MFYNQWMVGITKMKNNNNLAVKASVAEALGAYPYKLAGEPAAIVAALENAFGLQEIDQ